MMVIINIVVISACIIKCIRATQVTKSARQQKQVIQLLVPSLEGSSYAKVPKVTQRCLWFCKTRTLEAQRNALGTINFLEEFSYDERGGRGCGADCCHGGSETLDGEIVTSTKRNLFSAKLVECHAESD